MRHFTIRTLGLAAGLGALSLAAPAMAVPFTWNPSAVVSGADGTFTADNINVADYAAINVNSSGGFTETGLVDLRSFTNGGSVVNLPGLDQSYALYVEFTGSGTQGGGTVQPAVGSSIGGSFSNFSYSLLAASGKPTFSASTSGATVSGLGNTVTLASGSLINSTTTLANTQDAGLSAGANVLVTFNPNTAYSSFFVSPPTTATLDLFASITNTGSVLTPSGNTLVINGGGGNATLTASSAPPPPVPEPASFAVLGAGLIALTVARRQRLI